MEIVPTTIKKKNDIGLDLLLSRKVELKKRACRPKGSYFLKISYPFSVSFFTNSLFNSFNKGLGFVDAVVMGYKIIKSIRGLIRKFK